MWIQEGRDIADKPSFSKVPLPGPAFPQIALTPLSGHFIFQLISQRPSTRSSHLKRFQLHIPVVALNCGSAHPNVILDSNVHGQEPLSTMSSEQAAAQAAVAAASTPQQTQGTPQLSATTPASVGASSGSDSLVCQWQSCGERLPSAEQLYVSLKAKMSKDAMHLVTPERS